MNKTSTRRTIAWAMTSLVAISLALGCSASTDDPNAADTASLAPADEDADGMATDGDSTAPDGTEPSSEASPICDELEADATNMLAQASVCNEDADCTPALTLGSCMHPFLCGNTVRTDVDLDALRSQADDLSEQWLEAGCTCYEAACAELSELAVKCENSRCIVE